MGRDIPQDTKGGIPITLKEAITLFGYHQRSNLKPRTVEATTPSSNDLKQSLRSGHSMPLEIVSKVILRHQDLKTTQAYLGRVTESEAIRWMDVLPGR